MIDGYNSYYVIINGQPKVHISPTRGIREGDPLSPYLFILCAEALSSLLHWAEYNGALTGFPIIKKGTRLNHLLVGDDS
jgi:hypothetical protein